MQTIECVDREFAFTQMMLDRHLDRGYCPRQEDFVTVVNDLCRIERFPAGTRNVMLSVGGDHDLLGASLVGDEFQSFPAHGQKAVIPFGTDWFGEGERAPTNAVSESKLVARQAELLCWWHEPHLHLFVREAISSTWGWKRYFERTYVVRWWWRSSVEVTKTLYEEGRFGVEDLHVVMDGYCFLSVRIPEVLSRRTLIIVQAL